MTIYLTYFQKMKTLILTSLLATMATLSMHAQALRCSPEKPTSGETLTLTYDPSQTILANEKELKAMAICLNTNSMEDRFYYEDLNFVAEKGLFKAKFILPAKTNLFYVAFSNEVDKYKDNNGGQGYEFSVYQADRKTPLPGIKGNQALIKVRYSGYVNVERDIPKGLALLQEEFAANPAARKDAALLTFGAAEGKRAKDEAIQAEVKKWAEALANDKKATEQDQYTAYQVFKILDDKPQLEPLAASLRKKYPKGLLVRSERLEAVSMEKDLSKKVALYQDLAGLPFSSSSEKSMYANLRAIIASGYMAKNDWPNFEKYLNQVQDKSRKASLLNSAAWKLCGEGIVQEVSKENAELAAKLSKQSIDLIKNLQSSNDRADLKGFLTFNQMRDNLKWSLGMYADTYAACLYRNGKYSEALEYQQIYNDSQKFGDLETNERYCIYLEKAKGGKEAEAMLEKLITQGKASANMKIQFLRLFQANNSPEAAAQRYLLGLEQDAKARQHEELRKKMIDREAPDFKLRNLKGEEVALSSLKGKVVILDFWATWCGPCKASFPGMQKALDAVKNRSDVVFLFIDTWENGENKEKMAAEFIEKNNYPFNVLMDNDNKVVGSYEVEGIPTKFIIGKDGRIKFMSVGFNGTETLIEEVTAMIDLASEVKP
jgi:peroxiredoxin